MKRLLLLRHARAVAKTKSDRERELAPEGRAQMEAVATLLAGDGMRPARALVSPSARTRETWALGRARLGDVATAEDEAIYSGDVAALALLVRDADEAADCVILVGHNPTIHELAWTLVGEADRDRLRDFPTAALAALDFDIPSWSAVATGRGRLASFVVPGAAPGGG